MALTKRERRFRVKKRVRKKVEGKAERPRMSVFRSNKHINVQLIDDLKGQTMIAASSRNKEVIAEEPKTKSEQAKSVGKLVAARAKEAGIENVVFDRNGYKYHGRIKALADAAREGGLKF